MAQNLSYLTCLSSEEEDERNKLPKTYSFPSCSSEEDLWCAHLVPPELRQTPLHPELYSTIVPHEMEQTFLPIFGVTTMGQIPFHPEWCAYHVPPEMEQIPLSGEPYSTIYPSEWSRGRLHNEDVPFIVPHRLRQVNQTAYEPELISIGPCHHNKEHLRYMEDIKLQFFLGLSSQKGKETMDKCIEAMSLMQERAREWYDDSVVDKFNPKALEEMMLLDGCFIIELLCKEPQDQIAKMRWSRVALFCDLLLLENQLPFFVLVELYGLITQTDGTDFAPKAFAKLIKDLPVLSRTGTENPSTIKYTNETDHLLGLLHDNWLPSPQRIRLHEKYMVHRSRKQLERQSIRCARELEEAGIKFQKFKKDDRKQECNAVSLFDVNFTNGKMNIPTFLIDNNTERLFRNLIAYELFVQGSTYVIDYVTLMDNLVNTANDVKLLRHSEVIENMLGDDEAVAQMLNKLLDNVTLCGDTFFYEEIFDDVKKHCDNGWNTLQTTLKHDYFSNPWARIAFGAALLVFMTTIITFIYSFFKKN